MVEHGHYGAEENHHWQDLGAGGGWKQSRLDVGLSRINRVQIRSLFCLLIPAETSSKSSPSMSFWIKWHFNQPVPPPPAPSAISSLNLLWIRLSIFHRKLDIFCFSAMMSFSYCSFSEKEYSFRGEFVITRSTSWRPQADVLEVLMLNSLISRGFWSKLSASSLSDPYL